MNRSELLEKVKTEVPLLPGVYLMKNEQGDIIYVGKAKALKNRLKSYFDVSKKTFRNDMYDFIF